MARGLLSTALIAGLVVLGGPAAVARAAEPAEASPGRSAEDVEEMVVYGVVRPGVLAPIAGFSTSVISVDDYRAENKRLSDLLSETEGISVRRFGAVGDRSEISIRGSSPSQVVVTIDGVRANSVLTGGLDLSLVCLPLLERVEVTRGAGSASEGSGALGGVVNLVTRESDGTRETRAELSGGAFETWEGSLLHADRAGALDYSIGYCGFTTEGDFEFARPLEQTDGLQAPFEPDVATRVNNERVQHGATLSLAHPLLGGTLRLRDYAVYASGGEPGVDDANGETAGQSLEAHGRNLSNLLQLGWRGASPSGLGEELSVLAYHRFESNGFRDPMPDDAFRAPIDTRTRLSTFGLRTSDGAAGAIPGGRHALTLRAELAHDVLRGSDQVGRERPRAGGALEETLHFLDDRLALSAGGRLDWTDGFDVQLLPSASVVIAPFDWVRLRSHVERAYRAPSFDELFHPDQGFIRGNPDLSPEDAWNADVGVELALDALGPFSRLRLGAAWFHREIEESIVWILVNPETLAPVNTGPATTQGYELSASLDLTRYLRLSANHTQTDSRRDATEERLPGQATEETFARLRVGPEQRWKLVGEVERIGEILVNEGGSRRLPARTVWNASASLNLAELAWLPLARAAEALWVYVEVDNLSDEAVRDSVSFPQPGRNTTVGLELTW